MKIGIIDYGMGNLHSVKNALKYIGYDSFISSNPNELNSSDKLILPGVGAFPDAMKELKKHQLDKWISEVVSKDNPLLGICLGMQLLFEFSSEHIDTEGLGLLKGEIVKLDVPLKIPHMGWNSLNIVNKSPLFDGLENPYVYFVHSYYLESNESIDSAINFFGKVI